jgi:signal peptidase I
MPGRLRLAVTGWRVPAIAGLLVLVLGGLGFLRVWPPFAVVMSGSMAPTINTGDMVVLERLRAPARIGQIVAVNVPDATRARYGYPPVVIHRVFKITPDGQIRTKGDARPQPDPFTVPRSSVDRTVIAHIPSGGRVLAFIHSTPGLLWLAFGGLLLFGLPVLERQRDARHRDTEATANLHDQLAAVTGELARLTQLVEQVGGGAQTSPTAPGGPAEAAAVASASSGADDRDAEAAAAPPGGGGADAAEAGAAGDVDATPAPLPPALPPSASEAGDACESAVTATAAQPSVAVAASSVVAEPPAVAESTVLAEPPVVALDTGRVAAVVLPPAVPVIFGAALILMPPEAPRAPARVGRWDEPPCYSEASTTGWAAAPAPAPTRRFSRTGRLVAASQA